MKRKEKNVNSSVVAGSIPSTFKEKRGKENSRKHAAQKSTCNFHMPGLLNLFESQCVYLVKDQPDSCHFPGNQPVHQDTGR